MHAARRRAGSFQLDIPRPRVVLEVPGEGLVEGADLVVGDRSHASEGVHGAVDGGRGDPLFGRRDVQHVTGVVQHDQPVAGLEGRRQLVRDVHDTVAADQQRHPGREGGEGFRRRHGRQRRQTVTTGRSDADVRDGGGAATNPGHPRP